MAIIKVEGQEINLSDEIAADDEKLKACLSPFYPQLANALISRIFSDEQMIVTVLKQAGTKGLQEKLVSYLISSASCLNPAVSASWHIKYLQSTPEWGLVLMLELQPQIAQALEAGKADIRQVEESLKRLKVSKPIPSKSSFFF